MSKDGKIKNEGDIESILHMLDEHLRDSKEKMEELRRRALETPPAPAQPAHAPEHFKCPKCGELIDLSAVHEEPPQATPPAVMPPAADQPMKKVASAVAAQPKAQVPPAAPVPQPVVTPPAPEPAPEPLPPQVIEAPKTAAAVIEQPAPRPKKNFAVIFLLLVVAGAVSAGVYFRLHRQPAAGNKAAAAPEPQAALPALPAPPPAVIPPAAVPPATSALVRPEAPAKPAAKKAAPPAVKTPPAVVKKQTGPAPKKAAAKPAFTTAERMQACTPVWDAEKSRAKVDSALTAANVKYACGALKADLDFCDEMAEDVRAIRAETTEQRAAESGRLIQGWTVKKQTDLDNKTLKAYGDRNCAELVKAASEPAEETGF